MPSIAGRNLSPIKEIASFRPTSTDGDYVPRKRGLRSDVAAVESPVSAPVKRKSPRRCLNSSPTGATEGIEPESSEPPVARASKSPTTLVNHTNAKPSWNPSDAAQIREVKEVLHVSTAPAAVICREEEQNKVLDFCKACVGQEKARSLYVAGCPGTGKSLSLEKVKLQVVNWTKEAGLEVPDVLVLNCTSLASPSEIFIKMLGVHQPNKKLNGATSPLQHLQSLYSQRKQSSSCKMMLVVADELDYLITKDKAILHDLFMLTTFQFSKCILIGIANSIDLADRFLPRLQSSNCKPMVITFRAYSKDQILRILQERLLALPVTVFQLQALELCARKVAAASGDMRKALCICRSAVEILEAEMKESEGELNASSLEGEPISQQVRIDHMAVALSKIFRSSIVDTIRSLPQHQQVALCSAVKFFRGGKKDTTLWELNRTYMDVCKSAQIPPAGFAEFLSISQVLNDQGMLKVGQSREEKLKKVSLKVDESDVTFALQELPSVSSANFIGVSLPLFFNNQAPINRLRVRRGTIHHTSHSKACIYGVGMESLEVCDSI